MSTETPYGDPETRECVLKAAWALLEEESGRTRLSDVAERAGVSRQAVYLHFGDRSGLLVALVDFIDVSLGAVRIRAEIHGAATGADGLRRWIETMSWYTAKIDRVTQVLERDQQQDQALRDAWRDRMNRRQAHIRSILDRVAAEGRLAEGWSVDTAVAMVYVVTMPGPWRELTRELGWSAEEYRDHMLRLLLPSLLTDASA